MTYYVAILILLYQRRLLGYFFKANMVITPGLYPTHAFSKEGKKEPQRWCPQHIRAHNGAGVCFLVRHPPGLIALLCRFGHPALGFLFFLFLFKNAFMELGLRETINSFLTIKTH